ncbi:hypothetical protein JB92DRAFT_2884799 [Gautieria morchelliformis]|nr:hypothetical protein JB92DRAFT_2884799 [Gautieria morchelliformis]
MIGGLAGKWFTLFYILPGSMWGRGTGAIEVEVGVGASAVGILSWEGATVLGKVGKDFLPNHQTNNNGRRRTLSESMRVLTGLDLELGFGVTRGCRVVSGANCARSVKLQTDVDSGGDKVYFRAVDRRGSLYASTRRESRGHGNIDCKSSPRNCHRAFPYYARTHAWIGNDAT